MESLLEDDPEFLPRSFPPSFARKIFSTRNELPKPGIGNQTQGRRTLRKAAPVALNFKALGLPELEWLVGPLEQVLGLRQQVLGLRQQVLGLRQQVLATPRVLEQQGLEQQALWQGLWQAPSQVSRLEPARARQVQAPQE